MKTKKIKGLWIFLVAVAVCYVLNLNMRSDVYSTTLYSDDFRQRYLPDYTYESTEPVVYSDDRTNPVRVYTLTQHALSLEADKYDLSFEYHANDDSTILKIFASDYTSADNSGGKILLYEKLDPDTTYLKQTFELDQDVDSVYVLVETKDSGFQIAGLMLESWNPIYIDTYFYMALTIICAVLIFIAMNRSWDNIRPVRIGEHNTTSAKTVMLFITVAAIAVFVSSLPVIQDAFYPGHDFAFHTARIEGIAQGLASGQFPVRVHGETLNGYGYANSMFYPELLMYVPAALSLLGVSTITSYKFYIVFLNVLTLIASYLPFKKLTDSRYLAMTMAIVYLLNPYRLICAYFRSAIGEFAAITFLPMVFYGMYAVLKGDKKDWLYLVIGATGVLQCHVITTELTAIVAAIIVLVFIKDLFTKEKRIFTLIKSGIYAVLLNVWFICPMLLMMISIRPIVFTRTQSPAVFAKRDIGYLFATASVTSFGPLTVGWISLAAIVFYLLYRVAVVAKDTDKDKLKFADVLLWTAVICIIATTAYFPWSQTTAIPVLGRLLDTIQFPYRLLSLVGVCCTILAGYAVMLWIRKRNHRIIACIAAVLVSVFTVCLFYEFVFVRNEAGEFPTKHYYVTNKNNSLSVGQYEYLPSAADLNEMVSYSPKIESDNESLVVSGWTRSGTTMSFNYSMDISGTEEDIITIPFTYIPNYDIYVNGQKAETIMSGNYQVAFRPAEREGSVSVRYSEPAIFRLFEAISLLTLIWLLIPKKWIKLPGGRKLPEFLM